MPLKKPHLYDAAFGKDDELHTPTHSLTSHSCLAYMNTATQEPSPCGDTRQSKHPRERFDVYQKITVK